MLIARVLENGWTVIGVDQWSNQLEEIAWDQRRWCSEMLGPPGTMSFRSGTLVSNHEHEDRRWAPWPRGRPFIVVGKPVAILVLFDKAAVAMLALYEDLTSWPYKLEDFLR